MNKYRLIKVKINFSLWPLYRIQALKSFGDVKEGDLGGYVGNEKNLSQEGNCWIYDNARVDGTPRIFGNTKVSGDTWIYGNSIVIDSKVTDGYYFNVLIIPKDHPDFWDYRLAHPDLEVICLDK